MMAPSRGSGILLTRHILKKHHLPLNRTWRESRVRNASSFTEKLSNPVNNVQSYVSTSNDPYLNLSIEDHILRKSPPNSTVLFLYVNRPSVIIGRNQNPWTEVNLGILNTSQHASSDIETEPPAIGAIDLVRRRSGGGTVFHDRGNLNWSITCPRNDFTRDKHAEMVVRALRKLGMDRARVNERHDIVLDQGHQGTPCDPTDTHRTPYTLDDAGFPRPLKVSGSAYKLTRLRALHHATTLLCSPNLNIIPQYLHSPAKKYIQAKGVESVSSPVGNIGLDVQPFQKRLQDEFQETYASSGKDDLIVRTVGQEMLEIPDIRKGYNELQSEDWMWSQTPQFDVVLSHVDDIGVSMNVHHGIIKALHLHDCTLPNEVQDSLQQSLVDQKLHSISDWSKYLSLRFGELDVQTQRIANRLNEILPIPALNHQKT